MGLDAVLKFGPGHGGWFSAVLLAGLLVAGGVLGAPDRALAQSVVQTAFDVPAGPLSRALTAFGRQAGLQVSYLTVVCAGKESPGVSGRAAPEEALAHLLQGTGLNYSFTNATTVAVSGPSGNTFSGDVLLVDAVPVAAALQLAFAMWAFRAPRGAGRDTWRGNR